MKNLNYFTKALAGLLILFVAFSCKKEETKTDLTPVLHTNFDYTVVENVVKFTTTLTGNVWITYNGTDYPATDQKVEIAFAEKGTYTFTCSILTEGKTLTSTPFTVEVLVGDITVYDTDYWKKLTGGYGHKKEWVLDVEAKLHEGPLTFLGTSWDFAAGACANADDCWSWDAPLTFTFENDSAAVRMDWPGSTGYGVMSFDLIDGKHFVADKKKEPAENGTYELDWATRTISITGGTILRSYKPYAVKDGVKLNGLDGISDWSHYKIYALSDSVLRVAVSRDQDVQGEGVCYLVYNFVEKNVYESITITPDVYVEPVLSTFSASDLVGTWKYDQIAQDWIGWPLEGTVGGKRLNAWTTRSEMSTTLAGWGAANADSLFTANDANQYVFNNDGTCVLAGVPNTYSVSGGKITFGTGLTNEFAVVWISLGGNTVSVMDVKFDTNGNPYAADGLWLGQKNGTKDESSSVHLTKMKKK